MDDGKRVIRVGDDSRGGPEGSHLVLYTFQRWCYGRTDPSRIGSVWSYCGSYSLRMDAMRLDREDDGRTAKHSHEGQCLILLMVDEAGGTHEGWYTVIDTRIGGMTRGKGEPAPIVPDADGLQSAVDAWVRGTFPAASVRHAPAAAPPHP